MKPYNVLKLKGLDEMLKQRARELRDNPANWKRRIRRECVKEVIDWMSLKDGRFKVTLKTGEIMLEGASVGMALKNAYQNAGNNLYFFMKEEGSAKMITVPLYTAYLIFFSIFPVYPILETRKELRKLVQPITTECTLFDYEFEQYLEPATEQDKPDLDQMLELAKKEEAQSLRNDILKAVSARPKNQDNNNLYGGGSQVPQFKY